jgi:hypothetical protein
VEDYLLNIDSYCDAGATVTDDGYEYISNVTFADINNNSIAGGGYQDFTNVVGHVAKGSTYSFSVDNPNSDDSDQVYVWIDFNNDKTFDSSERVLVSDVTGNYPWTGNITIPADAPVGSVRMRVRLVDTAHSPADTDPCGNSRYGEVEDYTLNIGDLAVNNVNKNALSIYPNPFHDILKISDIADVKSISVMDMSGRQVKSLNPATELNLSSLNSGMYIVNLNMKDGSVKSLKAIKQ